ncbi:MAG: CHASE2 domain-containing protein, partial [Gammaproteobacteria bacterium]|nr:CHASE2 domain-containing protein [Gammaproteobacteria bacterium]
MIKENHIIVVSGLVLTLLISSLFIVNPKTINKIEYNLYDFLLAKLEQTEPSGAVIIIDIDEKSLAEVGQWPWPRSQVAELLLKLQKMQVLSVGIDFLFAEPDRSSLENVVSRINAPEHSKNILSQIPEHLYNNDQKLSQVLKSGPFVLGYSFVFDKNTTSFGKLSESIPSGEMNIFFLNNDSSSDNSSSKKTSQQWYHADGLIDNLKEFSSSSRSSGFFNMSPDSDSLIRKVPVVMQYQDKTYPSLALSTLLVALQTEQIIHRQNDLGISYLVIDDQEVPIDQNGNFWIHFRDTQESAFNTISAVDIINDRVPIEQVAGHIALLGTSAKGLFDLRSTPYNTVFPGVGVHATLIDNIIRSDYVIHPQWAWLAQLMLVVLVGLISLIISLKANALINFILNSLLIIGLVYASWWWLNHDQIYLSVFYPVLMTFTSFSFLLLIKYRYKEKKLISETL